MAFIEWDQQLETGDETIDAQHRMLFGMLNELHGATQSGDGTAAIELILDALTSYVADHFEAERQLMVATAYEPGALMDHMREHTELTMRTKEMLDQHAAGDMVTVLPLALFLQGWLTSHIRRCDRALAEHVRARVPA